MVFPSRLPSEIGSSSLSGDEVTQNRLKRRCKDFDLQEYWATHSQLINVLAIKNTIPTNIMEATPEETTLDVIPIKPDIKMAANQKPYNPWEHLDNAKKLAETPSEFLQRVPPLTSYTDDGWIWVANPYAPRDKKPEDRNGEYITRMRQLLDDYLEKKRKLTKANPNMAPSTVTRRLGSDRDRLREEIFEGAKKANMTCGKVGSCPLLAYSV
jgi:hypothetical protein